MKKKSNKTSLRMIFSKIVDPLRAFERTLQNPKLNIFFTLSKYAIFTLFPYLVIFVLLDIYYIPELIWLKEIVFWLEAINMLIIFVVGILMMFGIVAFPGFYLIEKLRRENKKDWLAL